MADGKNHPVDQDKKCLRLGMSEEDFEASCKEAIKFALQYHEQLKGKQPSPSVQPGFMKDLLPTKAPETGDKWQDVIKDFEDVIAPGITHWQSSRFFGYFPVGTSFPSILADIFINCCAHVGFTWISSPATTELEPIVLDWLARAIGLPDCFIYDGKGPGCGVVQGSSSESTIITLLAARSRALRKLSLIHPECTQHELLGKLVAYCTEYTHSAFVKACLVELVNYRKVDVDDNISLRGPALKAAMDEDRKNGKIPFYVCATLGTTACTSYDNLVEIGEVCDEDIWIHVDAAYAGSSFLCPEFRHYMKGIEMMTSFNLNPHKWLMTNINCSPLWVRNGSDMANSLNVSQSILRHQYEGKVIDYMQWQLPLGKRFNSLKLWFVMRINGLENLRRKIREDVAFAQMFERLVRSDERFEVVFPVTLGLVCFRLIAYKDDQQKSNEINKQLLDRIFNSKDIFLNGSQVEGTYFLRLSVSSAVCDEDSITFAWASIQKHAAALLKDIIHGNCIHS